MPLTPIKQAFDDSRCLRLIRDKVPFLNYESPALTTELRARIVCGWITDDPVMAADARCQKCIGSWAEVESSPSFADSIQILALTTGRPLAWRHRERTLMR